jgi:hypothetical protein
MITGYNTDVRHGEMVLHVQTEDKGLDNPFIESVLYLRGQVVATRRQAYAKLLEEGKGEREIAAMMEHQHRTIVAAIKAGRFDAMLEQVAGSKNGDRDSGPMQTPAVERVTDALPTPPEGLPPATMRYAVAPRPEPPQVEAPPPEAEQERGGPLQTLDQVILDYLSTEAELEQLVLTLDGQEEIRPGRVNHLTLRAFSSKTGEPISGVQVAVKMLSTVADPRTLLVAETDPEGALQLQLEVPPFDRGSAALIISGSSDLGRAEIKQLL